MKQARRMGRRWGGNRGSAKSVGGRRLHQLACILSAASANV